MKCNSPAADIQFMCHLFVRVSLYKQFQNIYITLNSIRKILPDKTIHDACHQVNYDYRNRFINPVVTVLHMILTAIWPSFDKNSAIFLLLLLSAILYNCSCMATPF